MTEPRELAVLLALDALEPLTPVEEQMVRDNFGYAPSETRSRKERFEAAERAMAGKPRVWMERGKGRDLAVDAPRPDFGNAIVERK